MDYLKLWTQARDFGIKRLRNEADAEDFASDVIVETLRSNKPQFSSAYVDFIRKKLGRDYTPEIPTMRQRVSKARELLEWQERGDFSGDTVDFTGSLYDRLDGFPELSAIRAEQFNLVWDLPGLDERERAIFRAFVWEGKSFEQIGSEHGIDPARAWQILQAVKARLRRQWK